mgnify:FL=1
MFNHNPRIVCQNGFSISVQGQGGSYSTRNANGELTHVECGFPSTTPKTKALRELAESTEYTETVYGWVPVEVVLAELQAHGGIISGKMP